MKKNVTILLLLLTNFALVSYGLEGRPDQFGTFKIKKEKFDKHISDQNETVISGRVKSKDYAASSFKIGFQQEGKEKINYRLVKTDNRGRFEMRFPAQKGVLYCSSSNNNEIAVPLREYKAQHRTVIHFKSTEEMDILEKMRDRPNYGPGMKKPVVYLYSDEDVNVDLKLNLANNGKLSFTYPAYNKGWNSVVNENGINVDGKTYPYLFWEGNQPGLSFLKIGNTIPANVIPKENVITFLEESLTRMGLNSKEMTDFITFWAPQMIQHEKVAVQFLLNEDYDENIAHLEVTPKPKNSLRIYMIYRKVDSVFEVYSKQELEKQEFKRDGLTLVEWGGTELEEENNSPWLTSINLKDVKLNIPSDSPGPIPPDFRQPPLQIILDK
jgi:hypothetical protein